MKRALSLAVLLVLLALRPGMSRAEVGEVTIAQQYGMAYLQFLVMQRDHLVAKHAKAAGLGDIKVTWHKFSASNIMYDAVLSGDLQIASGGLTPLITIWARTRDNYKVHGLSAMNAMPLLLNTREPDVKTMKDFTSKSRIALPAVKISQQAITLEMAAAKAFGDDQFAKLDPLTVSMSHPDAMQALLSSASEVTAHLTSPPYEYQELDDPRIHTVLNSYDVAGGPTTFTVLWCTGKFRDENPKTYAAVFAAFKEATDIVNKDKHAAARLYIEMEHPKLTEEQVYKMLTAPGIDYTLTPSGVMKYADFMYEHGLIKVKPASWKDVFFPEVHDLPGS
ncbi:MAG TPA: ABC transporter substrate-binding protein [Casimicrobiaceae bacterium]|nr:ABC transporter substrate-binding protein [Casimicrobiaceae bacterium]